MLLEGVGQSIQQKVTVRAVVFGLVRQRLETTLPAKAVEPGSSPGAIVEKTV
jgi:hypothetical protein